MQETPKDFGVSQISIPLRAARVANFSPWLAPFHSGENFSHVAILDRFCLASAHFLHEHLGVGTQGKYCLCLLPRHRLT